MSLGRNEDIVINVLGHHVPGFLTCAAHTTYPQTLTLPQGVKADTVMLTYHLPVGRLYLAFLYRDVAAEKFTEGPFSDKADPGAVFFVMGDETCLPG